uniref:UBA domain-containing protein n=1 Tax=Steinernema glaseri TaxID=37863 RepID=A0A1I7Z919_9BILA
MKYRKTRPSSVASTSTLSSLSSSSSVPSFKSYAATNWSRQMAFQGAEQHEVSEQIKKALDMGFKEEHIMAAFDANSGRSTNEEGVSNCIPLKIVTLVHPSKADRIHFLSVNAVANAVVQST